MVTVYKNKKLKQSFFKKIIVSFLILVALVFCILLFLGILSKILIPSVHVSKPKTDHIVNSFDKVAVFYSDNFKEYKYDFNKVKKVNFKEFDKVSVGDVLVEFDVSDLEKKKEESNKQIAELTSKKEAINQQSQEIVNRINEIETQIQQFIDSGYKEHSIEVLTLKDERDKIVNPYQDELKFIDGNISKISENIKKIDSEIAQNSKLSSDLDGIVTLIDDSKEAGLIIVENIENLRGFFQLKSDEIDNISIGTNINFEIDGDNYESKLDYFEENTEEGKGIFDCEFEVLNKKQALMPDDEVEVNVIKEEFPEAILINKDSIFDEEGKKYVFVYKDLKVTKKYVDVYEQYGDNINIKGISKDEEIVIDSSRVLKDGDKVKVKEG